MTRGYPFYVEQLRLITATTEALNALGKTGALEDQDHHIHVELRDSEGKVIGEWLDEIDATAWEFAMKEAAK